MLGIQQTWRRALLALGVILIATVALLPHPASASVPVERVASAGDGVRTYWTPARMRAAEPVEADPATALSGRVRRADRRSRRASWVGPAAAGSKGGAAIRRGKASQSDERILGSNRDEIADPADPAYAAHGKVFFTIPKGSEAGDYVCSGTAVNSRNRSLVWTAGHCVYDFEAPKSGGFSTNFIFVPGYKDGVAPYGEWPARKLGTTAGWKTEGNIRFDLGAAVVRTDANGRRLQEVVAATGIGFNQPRAQTLQAFGYPAVPPPLEFTGEREFRCTGKPFGVDRPSGTVGPATTGIECDMTAGSSGGGWVGGTTAPILLSVTSYGYPTELDHLYGPYMSADAKALYKLVRGGKKKKKKG